jgi:mono/diheme cytochrome c family protein
MMIRLRTLAILFVAGLVMAGAAGALVAWLGLYDVSATSQHTDPVYKLLHYSMRRSVQARADALAAPRDLDSPARIESGLVHYRVWCIQCHGAPGVGPDPLAFGLTPAPANLLAAGRTWPPGDIFWIVKHGIKMSGMPAWAWRLSDEEIWEVVAFVRAMPRLAPSDYEALVRKAPQQARRERLQVAATRPGEVQAGRQATSRYLCATCHTIPGFVSAQHHVGPPLEGMGTRSFIAGVVPNTPENMVRFLQDPKAIDPLSAMPPLGVTEQDARDIAAYLATLDKVRSK